MDEAVPKLAYSLVEIHKHNFADIETRLAELNVKQETVGRELAGQNRKLEDGMKNNKFVEMVAETKDYLNKLQALSKQMHSITERAAKVKRRALKLQTEKQHEDLERERQREFEAEREKQMIARPAKRP